MKIGILTFCCAHNFGAALQCYALVKYLSSKGHDVKTINYRPTYLASPKPTYCSMTKDIRQKLKDIRYYMRLRYTYGLYMSFEKKYLRLTGACRDLDELRRVSQGFDYVIIGSDQVWNGCYNGSDKAWWGEFAATGPAPKLLSYAASAGFMTFENEDTAYMSDALSRFVAISVREETLNKELTALCGQALGQKGITTVLDPTLLLPYKYWRKWRKPNFSGRYIVIYQGDHPDDNIFCIAQRLAQELDCKIVTTDYHANSIENKSCTFRTASPKGFVSLVMNAVCVLTNSFHGVAMSIVCRTPFYSFPAKDIKDQRVATLLASVDLQSRALTDSLEEYCGIDYDAVYEKLEISRKTSETFLLKNIV